jgi:DNA invertase Pin-like site-specific DNA recombinase
LQESLDATTATGRLMMNLLASVSQWEREVIGERTREALQHLKAQGKRYCHTVYTDAAIIDRMHHMRAAHLNDASVPTALGRRWQAMSVWTIVRRTQPKRQRRTA